MKNFTFRGILFFMIMCATLILVSSCKEDDEPIIKPVADFTATPNELTVTFTNASTDATSYEWGFGENSATSTDENPTYTYSAKGTYPVMLTAINGDNTNSKTVNVTVDMTVTPVAGFTMEIEFLEVQFTSTSTDAVSYSWDFGDGATSTDENPMHTYAVDDTYSVTLTVTSEDEITATETMDVTVAAKVLSHEIFINGTFDNYDDPDHQMNNDDWECPSDLETWVKTNVADGTVPAGVTSTAKNGDYGMKFHEPQRRLYQKIEVVDAKQYTVKFWVRVDGAGDANDDIAVYIFNDDISDEDAATLNSANESLLISGTGGSYIEKSITFTADGDRVVFYARQLNDPVDGSNGEGFIDEITIEEGDGSVDAGTNLIINGTFDDYDAYGIYGEDADNSNHPDNAIWKAERDKNNDDWELPDDLENWVKDNISNSTVTAGMTTSKNNGRFATKFHTLPRRIYQTVTVESGASYTLKFWVRTNSDLAVNYMEAYVFDSAIADEMSLRTNLGLAVAQGTDSSYEERTIQFTATSTTAVIYFRVLVDDVDGFIDDVTLTKD